MSCGCTPNGPCGDGGGEELIPTKMAFTEVFRQEWITPTGSGIVNPAWQNERLMPAALRFVDEQFTNPSTARFTNVSEATPATLNIAAGQMTLTTAAGSAGMSLVYLTGIPLGQPQAFAAVTVTGLTGTSPSYQAVLLGFVKDSNNFFCINWNRNANVIGLQVKRGGVNNFGPLVSTAAWGAFPTRIAISIVGNWATMYAQLSGSDVWIKVGAGLDISTAPYSLDFKAEDFSLWFPAFGYAQPGTNLNTTTFDNFQCGAFGGVGIRDICVVTHEDGSPNFQSPNVVRALATLAGASGGIAEASQGVFLIDLEKKTFTQTGVIMVQRGGRVQNDHADMMILEPNGDQHLTVSSWGDTPASVRILYKFVPAAQNLMAGRNTVAAMATLALPVVADSYWDPFLIKRGGLWYLAYTASPVTPNLFYPALASSPDLVNWTNIGSDPSATRYEGTRILPFNGQSYVLTGGQFNMRMYDLGMVYQGIVNCVSPGTGETQPHAMIFPQDELQLLITFDQTRWPTAGGVAFSWGSIHWFASPRF